MTMNGILYVVGTPIGNLQDITIRAVEVLRDVNFVVAENSARALKILNHFDIHKSILSINSYSEDRKSRNITERIERGESCALITSAGTPCISDPGNIIVKRCYEKGLNVRVIPGPSAAVSAVSISGLFADRFVFFGFLPQKRSKVKKALNELALIPYPVIFFESPRRVMKTLHMLHEEWGNREAVLFKEMTKMYEEVLRGSIEELIARLDSQELRGEYTIIVAGREKKV
ncbi:MAG: 16S rRNA (cytidine(1402)-2'-O)-methyltransferase [Syntrophorhabdaceae bacterium]|nr:16S rRNA (cytidine(1402)-2'-O)-methyltransferase [Syntrophorhabdaceae bacterium]MDD5243282.1 16S rRNA (cytidine(1402)-2'-O)-methyltransferase [Syntrophorhabdaceae bacterium]